MLAGVLTSGASLDARHAMPVGKSSSLAKTHWYAVRAAEGSEAALAARLKAVLPAAVLSDAFVISRERWTRRAGAWQLARVQMYPGYVGLASCDLVGLEQVLRGLSFPVRLAGGPGSQGVAALEDEAQAWYAGVLDATHTVRASVAVPDGGAIRVTQGPLVGRESGIVDYNRHKRTCYVRISQAEGGLVECFALDVRDAASPAPGASCPTRGGDAGLF